MHHPLVLLGLTALAFYVAKLWLEDLRAARRGAPQPGAWPGATPCGHRAILIAAAGALVLLLVETAGEISLAIAAEQSRMTMPLALYSILGAPVIEELIFRGFIVIENRGRAALWLGAIAASVIFAALHPFLWKWDDSGLSLTLTLKGGFSTSMLFLGSLWFYAARFGSWNPSRSLLPCVVAHATKNAGVVAIKAATGFVDLAW